MPRASRYDYVKHVQLIIVREALDLFGPPDCAVIWHG